MAWAEADRVQWRLYLGYSDQWLQADPRLEAAITNLQATPLGTRPGPDPSAAETQARATITKLQAIDTSLDNLAQLVGMTKGDEANFDAARETARLQGLGRMYVHRLARMVDTLPITDIYAAAPDADAWRRRAAYAPFPFGGRIGY